MSSRPEFFAAMQPGAFFINTSRAEVVDQAALALSLFLLNQPTATLFPLGQLNPLLTQAVPGVDWAAVSVGEEEILAQRLAGMSEDYPDVTVHRVVVRDQPARYLAEQAQSAQLLVVGSHGRGGFAGMLLGSVSTALAHTVTIPMIVARRY